MCNEFCVTLACLHLIVMRCDLKKDNLPYWWFHGNDKCFAGVSFAFEGTIVCSRSIVSHL